MLAELNLQRKKKFEELRRPTCTMETVVERESRTIRQVKLHEDESKMVISISNNTVEDTEDLSQVPSGPNTDNIPQLTPTSTISEPTDAVEEDTTTEETVPEEIASEEVLVDDTVIATIDTEMLDSSAPLFSSHQQDSNFTLSNTLNEHSFTSQDIIRNMAGNFTQTPGSTTTKLKSNYKFRRRQPLN